jgi:predicted DNA-binding protein (MmcQ/YjbR family)
MGKESPGEFEMRTRTAQELHGQFDDIKPGWHMSKIHWNTVAINKEVPDTLTLRMIDHSYDLVHKSLTKKMQVK